MSNVSPINSFAPIENAAARVLVLGSMPGVASLRAGEYYAHPRNHFWHVMAALFSFDVALPYAQRVAVLQDAGVAVWDVLQTCARAGSLDAKIDRASMIANDFQTFFSHHPHISHVFYNGRTAEDVYRRLVMPALNFPYLHYTCLPSTSPAHASLSFAQKLAAWQVIVQR